jgi:hypothetical protein
MLDQRQVELGRQAAQAIGDEDVRPARRGIARRMVVDEEEAGRADRPSAKVDLAEVDLAFADPAARHRLHRQQVELVVDEQRQQPLARLVGQRPDIGHQRRLVADVPRVIERGGGQIVVPRPREDIAALRALLERRIAVEQIVNFGQSRLAMLRIGVAIPARPTSFISPPCQSGMAVNRQI